MKFLTDENIAKSVVIALRKAGFDIKDIKEENLIGSSDKELLQLAIKENRVIITHDKDFSNIFFSRNLKHRGIILLRLKNQSPVNTSKILLPILSSDNIKDKIKDNLMVISESNVVIHKTH